MTPRLLVIALLNLALLAPVNAADEPVQADAVEVNETPFGRLGLFCYAYFYGLNYLVGGTPATPWLTYGILPGSPAHRAGVVVGDQIMAINGESVYELSRRRVWTIFNDSPAGTSMRFELLNQTTGVRRTVDLKMDSGKTWTNSEWLTLDFWGLWVRIEQPAKFTTNLVGNFGRRPKGIWPTGKTLESDLAAHGHILRITRLAAGKVAVFTGQDGKTLVGEFGPHDRITLKKDGTMEVTRRKSDEDMGETTIVPAAPSPTTKPKNSPEMPSAVHTR